MVDSHCHILHGLDDGARSMEDSIWMARIAAQSGIDTIIATPHHRNGMFFNEAVRVRAEVAALNEELDRRSIPLRVCPGQEVAWNRTLLDELDGNKLVALNDTQYLLLELPHREWPKDLDAVLYELRIRGVRPVIAHPERHPAIMERPELALHLAEKGAVLQLTARSVLGMLGSKPQRTGFVLCEKGRIHLVASDSHRCTRGTAELAGAYRLLERKFGYEAVHAYRANAFSLLRNESVAPVRIQRKSWLRAWR